jgi:ACS family hexuronate transporter-like MFS transporter
LRWLMIALAFAATAITYMERQALSVVVPVLMDQFHMTSVAYSRVIFAFMLAYTIMNGVSGALIDRLGTRVGLALTTAWWSMAAMLQALSRGAWSLGICRFLLGMGEAGNWPGSVKVVAEWFPAQERALASGIFNSGAAFGAIVAPPVVVLIVLKWGWRAAFLSVGLTAMAWVVLWLFIYRTPREVQAEAKTRPTPPWTLFRQRFVWSFTVAKIFIDPVWYFYVFWFPEYLKRARHLDLAGIGKFAWIPYVVAGSGNIIGGWFSGFLLRRGVPVTLARKSAVTVFIVLMASAIPAVLVPQTSLSIALVSLAMLGYTGVSANMLAFPADVYPKNVVASIWGLAGVGSGFGGMAFVLVTGWLVDRYSYTPVFIGFGLIPIIALMIVWFVVGPLRPISLSGEEGLREIPDTL